MSITTTSRKRACPYTFATQEEPAKLAHTVPTASQALPVTGISYKVTNKFGVPSYFIGTCHFIDKQSNENLLWKEITNKSSVLYTEAGNYVFNNFPFGTRNNEAPKFQHNPFRYPLDIKITEIAIQRKIPIIALDEGFPEQDELIEFSYQQLMEEGAESTEEQVRSEWEKDTQSVEFAQIFTAWKNSDFSTIKKIAKSWHKCSLKREAHWAKKLIPKLERTRYPICVAVGAAHLARTGSLLERCRRAGNKIEMITSTSDI